MKLNTFTSDSILWTGYSSRSLQLRLTLFCHSKERMFWESWGQISWKRARRPTVPSPVPVQNKLFLWRVGTVGKAGFRRFSSILSKCTVTKPVSLAGSWELTLIPVSKWDGPQVGSYQLVELKWSQAGGFHQHSGTGQEESDNSQLKEKTTACYIVSKSWEHTIP